MCKARLLVQALDAPKRRGSFKMDLKGAKGRVCVLPLLQLRCEVSARCKGSNKRAFVCDTSVSMRSGAAGFGACSRKVCNVPRGGAPGEPR